MERHQCGRLPFLIKVLFLDLIASAQRIPRPAQRSFCIIFTLPKSAPVITDLQVADGFKVAYSQIGKLHMVAPAYKKSYVLSTSIRHRTTSEQPLNSPYDAATDITGPELLPLD